MKNLILYTGLITIILVGCSPTKDEFVPTLPPITQTGENTFGCYVNGVLITPRDGSGTFNVRDPGMSFIAGPDPNNIIYNEIKVYDFASERTARITLHIHELDSIGVGEYPVGISNCMGNINSPLTNNIFCKIYDPTDGVYKEYCSFENSGIITITRYDSDIVSGTFSARIRNKNNNDEIVEITDGRFDIDRSTVHYTSYP